MDSYKDLELYETYQYKDNSGYDIICICTEIDKSFSTFKVISSGGKKWSNPTLYLSNMRIKYYLTKLS